MAVSINATTPTGARIDRYRRAEQTLWDHYGLEPSERFVNLDSPAVRLRVLEVGSGPPVLFIPGTAGTGPVWASLVRELSGFRCLLLDRPGWGLSSPLDYAKHDYGTVIADLLSGVLSALGIDSAYVVGSSIGNLWALRLATKHPSRVDAIVLLGGGPLVPEISVPPFIRLLASPVGAVVVRLPMNRGRVCAMLRQSGHGGSLAAGRIPDAFLDWRVTLHRDTDSMRSERDMVRAAVRGRALRPGFTFDDATLAQVRQPALLVYGTSDPVGSAHTWRRVVGLMPRAEMRIVEGGHVPWLDDPAQVAGAMRRFLA